MEELAKISKAKNEAVSRAQTIRMFFEQRDVAPLDRGVIKDLDREFIQKTEQPEPGHVLHEINFVADPSGILNKAKIDAEIAVSFLKVSFDDPPAPRSSLTCFSESNWWSN